MGREQVTAIGAERAEAGRLRRQQGRATGKFERSDGAEGRSENRAAPGGTAARLRFGQRLFPAEAQRWGRQAPPGVGGLGGPGGSGEGGRADPPLFSQRILRGARPANTGAGRGPGRAERAAAGGSGGTEGGSAPGIASRGD